VAGAISLRPTRPADLSYVTTLERDPANRDLIGQWSDAEHLAAIEGRERREHWIIERDGKPAGYMIAYDCRADRAGFYLKRILVEAKENGTGSEALRRFVAQARKRAVGFIWLVVFEWNARAQRVYRKLGFEAIDPRGNAKARLDRAGEPPAPGAFRMKLEL
jgi:ribosomal protein S18 acetylase RimI-like enzyme